MQIIEAPTGASEWTFGSFALSVLHKQASVNKPDFDRAEFCLRLEAFPNKTLGIDNRCTSSDILEYLQGDDYAHTDLYLWR